MTFLSNLKKIFKKRADSEEDIPEILRNTKKADIPPKEGFDFIFEKGRRFHGNKDIAYILPNDHDEADRVHQQHWVLRQYLERNYHAPVKELLERGITVLDSGCGPATWTFEMGETYPCSLFYGVDCSHVFPSEIMPGNVSFAIGNIANHIPFPDNTFDYIHQRLLILGLTLTDWDNALKELMRVLKPGGYIELVEPDLENFVNTGENFFKLQSVQSKALLRKKISMNIGTSLETLLKKTGFVNPVTIVAQLDLNHTDKLGELFWEDYLHGCKNMHFFLAKNSLEWRDESKYFDLLNRCGVEANMLRTTIPYYISYAQKPNP